jgi:hypothetical protein
VIGDHDPFGFFDFGVPAPEPISGLFGPIFGRDLSGLMGCYQEGKPKPKQNRAAWARPAGERDREYRARLIGPLWRYKGLYRAEFDPITEAER